MMDRRKFLYAGAAAGIATLAPMRPAGATSAAGAFRLVRLSGGTPPDAAARIRIWLETFVPAPVPVLARFRLQALFDGADGALAPFHVWNQRSGCTLGNSRCMSFTANASGVRGLRIDYALEEGDLAACRREHCATTSLLRPRWLPGRYVLAGPRADGRPVAAATWQTDPAQAGRLRTVGGRAPDFDYLALRVEALDA